MPGKSKSKKVKKDLSSIKSSHHSIGKGTGHGSKGSSGQNVQKQVWSGSSKTKNSGCLPKLFMLTLPLIIIGSTMFLGK
ncbi:MAG TPA: hypothetical protein VJZ78_00890 [Anaerolineales bacterium]|nr:hypothetical protein [Anaerolineales bacterium]